MNAQLLWQSRDILLERFRAAPQDPAPEMDGPVAARPAIAFPRAPVRIEPEDRPAFVADPTVAVLHNPGERHRRRGLGGRADVCDRISLAPELLFEVRPDLARSWGRPFHATHVPCPARAYLLLRHAVWYAESESAVPALLEEALLRLVEMVVGRHAPGGRRLAERPTTAERRMVESAKELLVAEPGERHTLESIALHVGCSPYHLSRVFRRATGRTPHAYLTHLRLRESLPRVLEPGSDLAAVAFESGFSSHSHFTATFRQTFGVTPSRLRRAAGSVTPAMLRRLLADSRRQAIV
jgi:AraC-like DNA-binding protein